MFEMGKKEAKGQGQLNFLPQRCRVRVRSGLRDGFRSCHSKYQGHYHIVVCTPEFHSSVNITGIVATNTRLL